MALTDYAGLQASVANFLMRGDLTAAIPDFIALAEAQMNRRLRVRRMITRLPAFSIDAEYVNLPADFAGPITFKLTSNRDVLDCIAPDAIAERKFEMGGVQSPPGAYCVNGDQFEFDAAPVDPYGAQLVYYARIPALSDVNTTNWLLANHPDAYLYGALMQSAPYLQEDERLSTWAQLFTAVLADIETLDKRESFGARLTPHTTQVA